MTNRYFEKFPVIDYNGNPMINIMRRISINQNVKNFLNVFYTYTAEKDDTIDNLAFNYYDDVDFDWLIYHANDISDPYYDVWLSEENFLNYIKKKYGSIRTAQRKIVYYKNNWESDDRIISQATYEALSASLKKYWHPLSDINSSMGYKRSRIDFKYSTNKVISYDFSANSLAAFEKGEIVYTEAGSSNYSTVGWSNTSHAVLYNIVGSFDSNTSTLTGEIGGVTANLNSSSYTNLIDYAESDYVNIEYTIPEAEQSYYSPVSAFDEEEDLNNKKREIYLVDESNKSKLNRQLETLMR